MQYFKIYNYYTSVLTILVDMDAVELTDYKDTEAGQYNQNVEEDKEEYNR